MSLAKPDQRVYKLSETEEKKIKFADLDVQFCLIILGEFQMQPIEATGLFNSTFAGNIKVVALPLAELQLNWRNKSLMQ